MGQYHSIYNKTKKEMLTAHAMDSGSKLLEWGRGNGYMAAGLAVLLCNSNGRGGGDLCIPYNIKNNQESLQAILNEIQGRWAGDEIVVQGDYAEEKDPAFISEQEQDEYKNISTQVLTALCIDASIREELLEESPTANDKQKDIAKKIGALNMRKNGFQERK